MMIWNRLEAMPPPTSTSRVGYDGVEREVNGVWADPPSPRVFKMTEDYEEIELPRDDSIGRHVAVYVRKSGYLVVQTTRTGHTGVDWID
ncbi:hypothetical protein VTK56DRAFT_8316 [Thermocarpiscus australiensis]